MNESDDIRTARRKDPAWAWYVIAAAVLAAVLILELSGALAPLTP